jgi:nucleotide-binding universal stress UspA family protein
MVGLMYKRILVCLENSGTDAHIVEHIGPLAKLCGASVLLIHVADGWAARNIRQLDLRESEEMREDREYLERVAAGFVAAGVPAEALLATGEPAAEVAAAAEREGCDLIAMATHGHKLIGDMIHGSVANAVRHRSMVPVLLVRAPARAAP